jgi:hypothetical protein
MNSSSLKKNSAIESETWIDWTNLALGAFLLMSPWIGLGNSPAVAWNAVICGSVIVFAAGIALGKPAPVAERTNAWLGIWLLVAPWVLSFTGQAGATWTSTLVGLAVACFAGIQLSRLKRSARA